MQMMYYAIRDSGILRKKKSEVEPMTFRSLSSDALLLSWTHESVVGAKAIKLG